VTVSFEVPSTLRAAVPDKRDVVSGFRACRSKLSADGLKLRQVSSSFRAVLSRFADDRRDFREDGSELGENVSLSRSVVRRE
jgi:hypothetical protein